MGTNLNIQWPPSFAISPGPSLSAPPINMIPLIRADSDVLRELTSFIACETPFLIPMS